DDHHDGKPWRAPHAAPQEPRVLRRLRQPFGTPLGALPRAVERGAVAPRFLEVAEFGERLAARIVFGHAVLDELRRAHVEVEADLVIHVGADPAGCAPGEPKETSLS